MKIKFNKNWHIVLIGAAFIMCIVSLYFGVSINAANNNGLITHLNEMDNIRNYSVEAVPELSRTAAFFTSPFLLLLIVFTLLIFFTATNVVRKRLALGLFAGQIFILIIFVLTVTNPASFDFSAWGFVWMTMGILMVAGNIFALFLPEKV